MIVDNDGMLLELLQLLLIDLGKQVTATHYTPNTFDQIEVIRPQLLILDLEPKQDECWQLLDRVQSTPAVQHIPILCLSTTQALLSKARKAHRYPGGAQFLSKPFDLADVENAIQFLLAPDHQVR